MHFIGYYILLSFLLASFLANAYKYVSLQDYPCAFHADPDITLGNDLESAAIISQVWNTTSNPKLKYDCRFKIIAKQRPTYYGLYTLISKLKFRRDPMTGACIDYIQFSKGQRPPSGRICNDISAGRLIFDERGSDVDVHVFINQSQSIYESLELSMTTTSHSECEHTEDLLCDSKNPSSCISRFFVQDNITNCIYPCKDENSCFRDEITAEVIESTTAVQLPEPNKYIHFGNSIASQLEELKPIDAAAAMADLQQVLSKYVMQSLQRKSTTPQSSS